MTKPAPKRYRTTNWQAYNQALIQRGSLSVWLDTNMSWQAIPRGTRGRTQTYSDAAIQFCLTIKNLFGLALRQTIGFIQSLLKLAGLECPRFQHAIQAAADAAGQDSLPEKLRCAASAGG